MSKLLIYRASAGSGKTYRLAAEYLKQLMKDPENFRRILAVTFTNKATAEMKGRIIEELFSISQGKTSGIGEEIMLEFEISKEVLQQRSAKALSFILHDYSSFSISTIDSFVQRVIQALLWELGEQGGADIQLDTAPILSHAADNLLDSASQSEDLLRWLSSMGENLMDEGGSWDVRKKLIVLGQQIFSESFRLMSSDDIERITDKKNISLLNISLQELIKDTIGEINSTAESALLELDKSGIDADLFKGKSRSVINFFVKCRNLDLRMPNLPDTSIKAVQDSLTDSFGKEWVNKEVVKNLSIFAPIQRLVETALHPKLVELVGIIEGRKKHYISAKLLIGNLENLALIGDLWHKVKDVSKEEGVLLLSDSNHLLREFVKGSDAPFIFEKIGTRYDSYMIDEFQDTSVVQWHNFKPLIENSLSQDSFSMLVGDVKQSIYRWRNGDWRILAAGVEEDFKHQGVENHSIEKNWRSLPAIVHFNNIFFKNAHNLIVEQVKQKHDNAEHGSSMENLIQKAYEDVEQIPQINNQEKLGYVEVQLIESGKNEEYNSQISNKIPQLIERLRERHKLGDIAVLVRKKADGQQIANMLLEHNRTIKHQNQQISFVSQEGLFLNSSRAVRLIIAAFRLIQNPNNQINRRVLAKEIQVLTDNSIIEWPTIFSTDYMVKEVEWLGSLSTLSLQECFDAIINRYNFLTTSGDVSFLAELHEYILNQSSRGGSDVSRFLSWWDENSEKLSLSVPESSDSISIITIHKSKGLEFPVVIVPYAGWKFRESNQKTLLWVSNSEEPFDMLPKYPIYDGNSADESLFAKEVLEESQKEMVDNLNLLYVAFTRPKEELYVFTKVSKNEKKNSEIKSIADIMHEVISSTFSEYCNNYQEEKLENEAGIFRFGEISTFHQDKEKKVSPQQTQWRLNTYKIGGKRIGLKIKLESVDFFQSESSQHLSSLEHGNVMHQLFSLIEKSSYVDDAVHRLIVEGLIDEENSAPIANAIKGVLSREPFADWFSGDWKVKTEATILTPSGNTYRPDRVMIKGDKTVVVDFKFGVELPNHRAQIKRYMKLLHEMKYENVKGHLWYVDANQLVEVT